MSCRLQRYSRLSEAVFAPFVARKGTGVGRALCAMIFVGCLLSGCAAAIFSKNFDTNYTSTGELQLPAFYAWKIPQESMPEASHSLYNQLQAGFAQVGLEPALSTHQPEYLIEVELGSLDDPEPRGTSTTDSLGRVDARLATRPLDAADVLTPLASAAMNQEMSPLSKTGMGKQAESQISSASEAETFLNLRIYRANEPSHKIYEHRVSTRDFGGDTARAMPPLLETLFQNFPGRP
jgi:hypothetical protein